MQNMWKALALACAGTSMAFAQGAPDGEKWKVTSSMQAAGMSMPGQSAQICKRPGEDSVPVRLDDNCQVFDMKRTGTTQSFRMRCTGEGAMEGSAQFTYLSPDHYQGTMNVKADGDDMTIKYEGRRLGRCDGSEANILAEKIQAEMQQHVGAADRAMAQECSRIAAEATSPQVMIQHCKDPADRQTFCAAVQTHDKFLHLAGMEKSSTEMGAPDRQLRDAAQVCGFEVAALRTRLCESAGEKEDFTFIASQCPAQGMALAQRHCAGRNYSSINPKYQDFCASYAAENPQQQQVLEQAPTGRKGLMNLGKKALGGLLGN